MDDAASLRPSVRTIREQTLRGSDGGNKIVERAIQSITHQTRILKQWLQDKGVTRFRRAPDATMDGGVWRCCPTSARCRVVGSYGSGVCKERSERRKASILENTWCFAGHLLLTGCLS